MTNLIEKARAGRTKALQNRAERRITSNDISGDRTRSAAERRNELPVFISSRTRMHTPAYLH